MKRLATFLSGSSSPSSIIHFPFWPSHHHHHLISSAAAPTRPAAPACLPASPLSRILRCMFQKARPRGDDLPGMLLRRTAGMWDPGTDPDTGAISTSVTGRQKSNVVLLYECNLTRRTVKPRRSPLCFLPFCPSFRRKGRAKVAGRPSLLPVRDERANLPVPGSATYVVL